MHVLYNVTVRDGYSKVTYQVEGVKNQAINYNQLLFKLNKMSRRETPTLGRITPANLNLDNIVKKLQEKVRISFRYTCTSLRHTCTFLRHTCISLRHTCTSLHHTGISLRHTCTSLRRTSTSLRRKFISVRQILVYYSLKDLFIFNLYH